MDESQGLAIIRIPFGKGIAGKVAELGTSMNIPDVYQSSLFNPNIDRKTGFKTRNILCVPIYDMSGKNVAVVQVRCVVSEVLKDDERLKGDWEYKMLARGLHWDVVTLLIAVACSATP